MTLVEYKRWPHGAMVRLTNGSDKPILYLAERNGLPTGHPIFCLQKTSAGWTNQSLSVMSAIVHDPATGKRTEVYFPSNPLLPPKPGDSIEPLTTVRVLNGAMSIWPCVHRAERHARRCERFELFTRFSPSRFFAKLSGCIPENSSSPNSPI
jgi:hypothetical protein